MPLKGALGAILNGGQHLIGPSPCSDMTSRIILAGMVAALLATNWLTLTSATFHRTAFDLLSRLPIQSELTDSPLVLQRNLSKDLAMETERSKRLGRELKQMRARIAGAKDLSRGIAARTSRRIRINVSTVLERSAPYLGTALVIATTIADVQAACETLTDLDSLLETIDGSKTDERDVVCGTKVPQFKEVLSSISSRLKASAGAAKESTVDGALDAYNALGGTLHQLLDRKPD